MELRQSKYGTWNPVGRYLLRGFFARVREFVSSTAFGSVLEVGCGEGVLLRHLEEQLPGIRPVGLDIDPDRISVAKTNAPFADFMLGSAYEMPFRSGSFDLVICCEVLEHLGKPERALGEISRVCRGACVLSVPNEPLWRVLNMARGRYVRRLGNTPGHVNHWSARGFRRHIAPYFRVEELSRPLPWIVALCRVQGR